MHLSIRRHIIFSWPCCRLHCNCEVRVASQKLTEVDFWSNGCPACEVPVDRKALKPLQLSHWQVLSEMIAWEHSNTIDEKAVSKWLMRKRREPLRDHFVVRVSLRGPQNTKQYKCNATSYDMDTIALEFDCHCIMLQQQLWNWKSWKIVVSIHSNVQLNLRRWKTNAWICYVKKKNRNFRTDIPQKKHKYLLQESFSRHADMVSFGPLILSRTHMLWT